MKKQIFEYIKKWDHVSFIELSRQISGFDGTARFLHPDYESILLWDRISVSALYALLELLEERAIFIYPLEVIFYINDRGRFPTDYPATSVLKQHNQTHWYPASFSYSPPDK